MWLTARTHRHEAADENGLPVKFVDLMDAFDAVVQLKPEEDKIHIRAIKGASGEKNDSFLMLDPASLLITGK